MLRIKLIVTGDMERAALHRSLRRFFPETRDRQPVLWETPQMTGGATTHQLVAGGPPSTSMQALAQAMVAEVKTGKTGKPADLVVGIDDVELGNHGRESIVVEHFRAAMHKVLGKYDSFTQDRLRTLLREKCSFHLLCPMVESYLFGDPSALLVAGVPPHQAPMLVHPTDVEQFETNDPAWLPTCALENQTKQSVSGYTWWRHERHPKHYLEHLAARGDVTYDETRQGKEALSGLDWPRVPACSSDAPVVRALFEDLSDWFGVQNPLGSGDVHASLFPAKTVPPTALLLRNV